MFTVCATHTHRLLHSFLSEKCIDTPRVFLSLSLVEGKEGKKKNKKASKGLLRCLWIFPLQTIVSQCQVVGTGYFVWMKRCLGGMWGLVREGTLGGKHDNSHSIQIYGQDRGAPLDAR